MKAEKRSTISVTTFYVDNHEPTAAGIDRYSWFAVATIHSYNALSSPGGLASHSQAVLSGEAFEVLTARATAPTEQGAAKAAVNEVLSQCTEL